MLTTPRTFGEIARVGPIRRQATKVVRDARGPGADGYVAVALPEEMPVNETIELERRLRDAVGLGLDAIVMNAMWPERFSSADVTKLRAADARRPRARGARRGARGAGRARAGQGPARARAPARGGDRRRRSRTLPFVFESDLELEHYEQLAAALLELSDARAPPLPARAVGLARVAALVGWGSRWRSASRWRSYVDALAPWAWVVPLALGLVVARRWSRRCAGRAGAGTSRRGHRHPVGRVRRSAHAGAVGARPARRHPPRHLRAGLRALDRRRPHRGRAATRSRCCPQAEAEELRERIAGLARAEDADDELLALQRSSRCSTMADERRLHPSAVVDLLRLRAAQLRLPAARDRRRDAARRPLDGRGAAAGAGLRRHRPA